MIEETYYDYLEAVEDVVSSEIKSGKSANAALASALYEFEPVLESRPEMYPLVYTALAIYRMKHHLRLEFPDFKRELSHAYSGDKISVAAASLTPAEREQFLRDAGRVQSTLGW
jgi:hypothetical protein